ncbi:hypothetical protein SAMN04488550_0592 [Gordonia malaquae]|uniref:Uncharacterized protein n=1 Tax=Gordonia malaquae NBRC 108250 TaxID=1223542 RepID=M3THA6_GORML|nr:hypothetical protein [Gordonia malaquae]GAC80846.1 hypothetical protein GM1_023_00050 [Gordonia malaquae NBRC 108250]SEB67203.1 hypothetical protein SAMN04488550_0592 [Gordonia malaquae]
MNDQVPEERRIAVTLTKQQAERLRVLGAEVDLSVGLLSRALVEHGLDHADDAEVREAISRVREADRERRRRTGARVMKARHQQQKKEST